MRLEITETVDRVVKNTETRPYLKSFFGKLFEFAEKIFGLKIVFKLPTNLTDLDLELKNPIIVAEKLQQLGIFDEIYYQKKFPDEPFIYFYHAYSGSNRAYGKGADFFSRESALWKAIAEATERSLWINSDYYLKTVIKSSYRDIKDRAMDIFSLAGFNEDQKKLNILKFDEDSIFGWLPVLSLLENKKVLCPAQLFSAKYAYENSKMHKKNGEPASTQLSNRGEPVLRLPITTGLATAQSYDEALLKGIIEVIERDAFMISYLNKLPIPLIDIDDLATQDNALKELINKLRRYNLELYLLKIPTDFNVYVISALIIDKSGFGPALSMSTAANPELKDAIISAINEAMLIRIANKKIFDPKAPEVTNFDRIGRIRYWIKTENLEEMDFLLNGPIEQVKIKRYLFKPEVKIEFYKNKVDEFKKEFLKRGYHIYVHNLTIPEIKKLGLYSVMVLIPELQPLYLDEKFPYIGGKRLREIPKKLGFEAATELNKIPHPLP